jgi:hypothetical protein
MGAPGTSLVLETPSRCLSSHMRPHPRMWAVLSAVLTMAVACWWVLNVYAPPARAIQIAEEPTPKALTCVVSHDSSILRIKNTERFAWTDVSVTIWMGGYGGDSNPRFKCVSPSTVPSGQVLVVFFRECANPLPSGVESAYLVRVEVRAREGFLRHAFEQGIAITPNQGKN